MSLRDDSVTLSQMLDHAREAADLVKNRSRQDLDEDRLLNLALVRLVEVVGEAATRVSSSCRSAHPELPWPQIIALRNRLIHGYDAINFDMLWQILTAEFPALVGALEKILNPPRR